MHCRSRTGSPVTTGAWAPSTQRLKIDIPSRSAIGCAIVTAAVTASARLTLSRATFNSPPSTLEKSRMSSIRLVRCCAGLMIEFR